EIGAADGLAAQPDVVPTYHRVCVPLVEKVRVSVHQTEPRCQAGHAAVSRRSRPGIEGGGPAVTVLRWGILGAGRIAPRAVRAIDADARGSLLAVASRDRA